MSKEQFYKCLERILIWLEKTKTIRRTKSVDERWEEMKKLTNLFMDGYFELYLLIRNNPDLKLDDKYQEFIEQNQYYLSHLTSELDDYVSRIEDRLRTTFYDNEWEAIICRGRSAIEALKELYCGTSFEEFYEGDNPDALILDTEDLDDDLESFSHKEGYLKEEDIPREIPTSHWWWWSPNEPPNYIREEEE